MARAGADVCASTVTPAPFTHTTTSANTFGSYTLLDETAVPLRACDIAGVFVTPDWNPSGNLAAAFDTHQVGVWYDSSAADWAIANEDGAAMPIGAAFNVHIEPNSTYGDTWLPMIATTKTIVAGYIFELNLPTVDGNPVNGNPSVHLIVTQDYDFGGTPPSIADPHQIGIWYDSSTSEWTIYNENRAPIPAGAGFNVLFIQPTIAFSSVLTENEPFIPRTSAEG